MEGRSLEPVGWLKRGDVFRGREMEEGPGNLVVGRKERQQFINIDGRRQTQNAEPPFSTQKKKEKERQKPFAIYHLNTHFFISFHH
jgi:hypothetical protein